MDTFKSYFKLFQLVILSSLIIGLSACDDDDDTMMPENPTTGNTASFTLSSVSDPAISGSAKFEELEDGTTLLTLDLSGTSSGNSHPAHIHMNTAAEGGDIAISLTPVDGASGMSETIISALDNGTTISYSELISFDGYINVHMSASDLSTLVAQGDIGDNALTGEMMTYDLSSVADPSISGTATFAKRMSGDALVTLDLAGTPDGGMHPAHIHMNTAAEGGDIAISLTTVDGTTGMSKTSVSMLDDGTAITYAELIEYDGYINVHLSGDDLATLVAQGDIGQNALTGEMMSYDLMSVADPNVSGTATFYQRMNDETLLAIELEGTTEGNTHPAHIHMNTAAEGGGIAVTISSIDGATGMSKTNISMLDDGTAITYDEVIDFDGYINVHNSIDDLGTLIAQGDIGQNALTGEMMTYDLASVADPSISGTATFYQRMNDETLVTIMLEGTPEGGSHPSHIHMNTAAEGGDIAISLGNVNGTDGMSKTNVSMLDDGTAITYAEMIDFDGYINVHLSSDNLATLVAQGDIGQNALTGESVSFALAEKDEAGISGMITFYERMNDETLAVIELMGVTVGDHPSHIHAGSVDTAPGDILISLSDVDAEGIGKTNITMDDAGTAMTYNDIITVDGYVNVHASIDDLGTLIAQGNVGSNATE